MDPCGRIVARLTVSNGRQRRGETVKRCSIPFETLADYYDGRVDENAVERIREHLAGGCGNCTEGLAWLQRTTQSMREAERTQVPQALVDRLHSLYAERFRAPVRRSLLARLSFDSRPTPALSGARGSGEEAFKLNYRTDEHDIDIWEEPAGEGAWYLIGQVLPREGDEVFQPRQVVLTAPDGAEQSVIPELQEFHVSSVPSGVYKVAIRLDDSDILIPEFAVGQGGR